MDRPYNFQQGRYYTDRELLDQAISTGADFFVFFLIVIVVFFVVLLIIRSSQEAGRSKFKNRLLNDMQWQLPDRIRACTLEMTSLQNRIRAMDIKEDTHFDIRYNLKKELDEFTNIAARLVQHPTAEEQVERLKQRLLLLDYLVQTEANPKYKYEYKQDYEALQGTLQPLSGTS
jgi:hypothetical protein